MAELTLVAEENVNAAIISALRSAGFHVVSIRESMGGATDREVLEEALSAGAILLTEVSDFGKLVFSNRLPTLGVVFLRYAWTDLEEINTALFQVLSTKTLPGAFITITTTKIRTRRLP